MESVPIFDEEDNISSVVSNCIDVTELNFLKEQLEHHIRINSPRYSERDRKFADAARRLYIVSRSPQMKIY